MKPSPGLALPWLKARASQGCSWLAAVASCSTTPGFDTANIKTNSHKQSNNNNEFQNQNVFVMKVTVAGHNGFWPGHATGRQALDVSPGSARYLELLLISLCIQGHACRPASLQNSVISAQKNNGTLTPPLGGPGGPSVPTLDEVSGVTYRSSSHLKRSSSNRLLARAPLS